MRKRTWGPMTAITVLAVMVGALSLTQAAVEGQSRTADGHPDFGGIWAAVIGGSFSIEDLTLQTVAADLQGQATSQAERTERTVVRSRIVDPADGRIPYQPWARAKQQEIFEGRDNPTSEYLDPRSRCFLNGVPRAMHLGPIQIVQTSGLVLMLFEDNHAFRTVPMDGRPRLGQDIQLWQADSRGHWEGDTLVIDVTNFSDQPRFDVVGNFHSDALHVVERFRLVDVDTIDYRATMDDPKVYTRPWTMAIVIKRVKEKGFELLEQACHEGNLDVKHILRGGDADKAAQDNKR